MFKWQGISFAKDWNKSFADFEKEFGANRFFKAIPHLERTKEMKKVYNDLIKHNGKLSGSTKKSEKSKTKSNKA